MKTLYKDENIVKITKPLHCVPHFEGVIYLHYGLKKLQEQVGISESECAWIETNNDWLVFINKILDEGGNRELMENVVPNRIMPYRQP